MSAEVASASVAILPTFKGGAKDLERVMGPALDKAGLAGGQAYGQQFNKGLMSQLSIGKLSVAGIVGTALFKGIGRYKAIDEATAKLRGLGSEAAQVDMIMQNALASVRGTAFGLGDAVTVAAQLTAAQIPAGERLEAVLTSVANSAAAAGSSLGDMGSIYAKVASLGKAQNDVLQQVADRGLPIYQALATQMGITTDAVFKLASAGKIGFAQFEQAMTAASGTVAKEMGSTLTGSVDNLMASLGRIGEGLVGGGLKEGTQTIQELTKALTAAEPAARVIGSTLGSVLHVVNMIPGPMIATAVALGVLARNRGALSGMLDTARMKGMYAAESFRAMRVEAQLAGAAMPGLRVGIAQVGSTARAAGAGVMAAFGGPVGLAVTGVTIAVGGLISLWQEGEQAAQAQKDAVDQLTASLNANTGAVTELTVADVAENLDDAILKMQELGLDTRGLAQAVIDGGSALDGYTAKLRELVAAGESYDTENDVDGIAGKWHTAKEALAAVEGQAKAVVAAQERWTRQTDASGRSVEALASAFDGVKDAVDAAFAGLDGVAAQETAVRRLAEAILENGNVIDATSKGGIANLEALQGVVAAMAQNAGDNYQVFTQNLAGLMSYLDQQGVNTQNVMGAVRSAVQNVAGQRWAMYLDGSQLIGEAGRIIQAIKTLVEAQSTADFSDRKHYQPQIDRLRGQLQAINSIRSTFTGVSSAASAAAKSVPKATSSIKSAGKSAKETAADLKALRSEIYATAQAWLKPSPYSSDALNLIDMINAAYSEKAVNKSTRNQLLTVVKQKDLALQRIADQREVLAGKIDDANQKLQDAIAARADFRDSIIRGFRDLGDLARFVKETEKTVTQVFREGDRLYSVTKVVKSNGTAKDLIDGLRDQVGQAKQFRTALDELRRMGLNGTSVQNLLTDFLSTGDSSLAESLRAGGKTAVQEVNDLMVQLGNVTGSETSGWAKSLSDEMHRAGIDTAKGFLKGLQSQDSDLKKQYEKMADDLLTTIKTKLGIKSPSRKTAYLAEMTSRGWNDNLHLDPITPDLAVPAPDGNARSGRFQDEGEVWLLIDGEPVRAVVRRELAGAGAAKAAARRGGRR